MATFKAFVLTQDEDKKQSLEWTDFDEADLMDGDVTVAATRIGAELVSRGALEPGSVIVLVSVTADLAPGPSNVVKVQRV